MTKADLIKNIANELNLTNDQAELTVRIVINAITTATKETGTAPIPGLGKLVLAEVPAKSGKINGKEWSNHAHKTFKLKLTKEGKSLL